MGCSGSRTSCQNRSRRSTSETGQSSPVNDQSLGNRRPVTNDQDAAVNVNNLPSNLNNSNHSNRTANITISNLGHNNNNNNNNNNTNNNIRGCSQESNNAVSLDNESVVTTVIMAQNQQQKSNQSDYQCSCTSLNRKC